MALLEKAQAQGVEVHFGMKLTDLREGDIGVGVDRPFDISLEGVPNTDRECRFDGDVPVEVPEASPSNCR